MMLNKLGIEDVSSPFAQTAPPVVVFVHLVNTGGLSLLRALRAQYAPVTLLPGHRFLPVAAGARRIIHIRPDFPEPNDVPFERQLTATKGEEVRVVVGHFRFGIHEMLDRPSVYCTMVRDPAQRVVSYYHWLAETCPRVLESPSRKRQLSFEEWLDEPRFQNVVRNEQTQFLSGKGGVAWHPFDDLGCRPDDPELLRLAKANVESRFVAVGVTERFDESVVLFQRTFGWRTPFTWDSRRIGRRPVRNPLPSALVDKVAELNELDRDLYRFVSDRFARQLAWYEPTFASDIQRLKRRNRWVEEVVRPYYELRRRLA